MVAWNSWLSLMEERIAKREEGVPWFTGNKIKSYDFVKKFGVRTPELFYCLSAPDELIGKDLPERFVCKPANLSSSQGVMVLSHKKGNAYINKMNGKEISLSDIVSIQNEIKSKVGLAESQDYGLILEEWLVGESQNAEEIPYDYKFFCYGEKIVYIAQYNRNERKNMVSWFLGEFESEDMSGRIICDWKHVSKGEARVPSCAAGLASIAKKLSRELKTPFVRVDMYAAVEGPVFGEFTLTPGAAYYGDVYKYTDEFDRYCGLLWEAEKINIELNRNVRDKKC